uniref:Growth hormone receptor n=1 Tax=Romanomermis culicivorax TaxID=13658 RepID=A0A915JJV1_ROMCU
YDYKDQYIKGKENACTNFLSQKDDCEKPPILSMEDLATKIFRPKFCPAGAISDANHTVTDILSAQAPPPMENDADVNAITCPMTNKPINQPTLSDPMLSATYYAPPPVEAIVL